MSGGSEALCQRQRHRDTICRITTNDAPNLLGQQVAIPHCGRPDFSPWTGPCAARRPTHFLHVLVVFAEILPVHHALSTRVV